MSDIERKGAFYLGKEYDLEQGRVLDEPVMYDARDLTTHAVCIGMTGSGKSTHSMWVFDESNAEAFRRRGLDVLSWVRNQFIKNDDIVALFEDCCLGSERGSWTKTEDVDESQIAIYKAGMASRALHENTGVGPDGNPDFLGETLYYRGALNRNARTVMYLDDMRPYFDGSIDIHFPPNMAVFITPGFLVDHAWVKLNDPDFAAAVLAAGRTVGHPAQAPELAGMVRFVPLYNPFIIGKRARRHDHVHRFREFLVSRPSNAISSTPPAGSAPPTSTWTESPSRFSRWWTG